MLKNPEYSREAISISPLWGSEIHPMEEKLSKISKKGKQCSSYFKRETKPGDDGW